MNKERFKRIIDFMENVPEEKFNFNKVQSDCGTMHCIIGFLPQIFPEERLTLECIFDDDSNYMYPHKNKVMFNVEEFLNISEEDLHLLTESSSIYERMAYGYEKHIDKHSSLEEVLDFWKFYYNRHLK